MSNLIMSENKQHSWLRLDKIKEDSYRGECDAPGPHSRVFGGQVLAQALKAAYETIPAGFLVNSFHCYFIRGGEERIPIIYEVKRIRNGRNFCIRTVEAVQHGKVIHSSEFSFQREGSASNFTVTPKFPNVPPPEALRDGMLARKEVIAEGADPKKLRAFRTERIAPSCEIRPCDENMYLKGSDGRVLKQYIWMRYYDPVDCADLSMAHSTLAYVSDIHLIMTGMLPFPSMEFKLHTSLDHSAWYHEFRFDINEWILYEQECIAHSANRSLIHGKLWSRSGRLLMSTSQEGLIYPLKEKTNGQDEKITSKI